MKILLIGDYPNDPKLGSSKVPLKLAAEFVRLGHSCRVVFADEIGAPKLGMRLRWLLGPWLALRAIRRIVAAEGPFDVIDIASAEGFSLGVWRLFGGFKGVGIVSRSHGLEQLNYARMIGDHKAGLLDKPWYKRWWYPLTRCTQVAGAGLLAHRMIVINENDRRYVIRHLWKRSKKVVVIPHGVSEKFLKSAPADDAPRGKGLLYCGTWTGMKGVDYLKNAYNRLVSDGTKVPFTILGGGVTEVEIREGFTSEANKLITIIPRLAEAQLMEQYRQHDILVFPSTYEGFGMVLLEAMSQGVAVVATPQGAALSLIQDEVTGIEVPIRNPVAITAAVRRLWEDVGHRRSLGRAARTAVAGYTWEATALKTLAVYEEAVDAARP